MASSANKKDTINLGLCGAAGRMGREILSEAMLYPNIHVAKAYEIPGHRLLGRSLGTAALEPDTAPSFLEGCEVLVDFSTTAEAILTHLQRAAERQVAAVVGATGLDQGVRDQMEVIAGKIPLLYSANMSLGVNVLLALAQRTQELIGGGFDVDIVETHHRGKKDAPSGTALMIEHYLRLVDAEVKVNHHSVRAGDIVGEHTVLFTGIGERLELTHRATSRKAFTTGVFAAVRFVCGKPPGMYDMRKVLGI